MSHRLTYLLYRLVETLVRPLPVTLVWRLGWLLGAVLWLFAGKYRKLAARNLTIAFGREKTPREIRGLARRHFRLLAANLLTSLKTPWMPPEKVRALVTMEGMEHVRAAVAGGRGFVYALCHMGNWEILTLPGVITPGLKEGAMYQALQNPFLNEHVRRVRERRGCRLFDRKDGFHAPARWLREGGAIGILADQHAGDGGVWTPFFGRLASTTTLLALLSRRAGVPVLTLSVETVGPARWRLRAGPPLPGAAEGLSVEQSTAAMNQALEEVVRRSPADWFWVHDRWKTPNPGFLLARYRRGIALPPGLKPEALQPFHVIIRSPNWLGDACMAIPMVRAIRRGRPDARVTILTPEKLAGLWKHVPEADHVLPIPAKKRGVFSVARFIRKSGRACDAAVLCPNSLRSAAEAWLADVPRVAGYAGHSRRKLLNQIIPPKKQPGPVRHHAHHYLRIAWRLGADVKDPTLWAPLPRETFPAPSPLRLGVCAGAEYGPAKRWPLERFADTILDVQDALPGIEVVLFGAPGEKTLGETLERMLEGQCENLVGKTSLKELTRELQRCHLVLTNDTGTMHLAAAFGVPVAAIFGSTEPAWTGPLGDNHLVLRRHVECSPCFLRECPMDFRCMKELTVDTVSQAVITRLRRLAEETSSTAG